jgi:hypothetical protein
MQAAIWLYRDKAKYTGFKYELNDMPENEIIKLYKKIKPKKKK